MSEIGKALGDQRLQDFISLREVAAGLGLNPQTVKRWLRDKRVLKVTWGKDRRGWVFVHRESVHLLRAYRDSIKLK
jgi:DNA-binding transcriptional regulator YhcF (GntR family)